MFRASIYFPAQKPRKGGRATSRRCASIESRNPAGFNRSAPTQEKGKVYKMEKEYKVRVEFKNGKVYEQIVSAWLWEEVILKDIKGSDNILRYEVDMTKGA